MAVDYLGTGNDDGTNFGRSDDKIGFYGLTAPITKPSFTYDAVSTSYYVAFSTVWAFASSTVAADLVGLVNDLRAQLVALGLVTT